MRVHFLTQPWASALPPSESIATWSREVGRRLARENEVVIWARRGRSDHAEIEDQGIHYRFVVGNGDYRLLQAMRQLDRFRSTRRPGFASPLYHASYHLSIARRLRAARPDVVHIHNFSQVVPFVRTACPRAVLVLHMHAPWLGQLDPRLLAPRLRKTDLILGCSEYITSAGRSAFPELGDRFQTVYNGFDAATFRTIAPVETTDNRVRFLYVGRISPEKGVHHMVAAFAEIASHRPEIELVVVGKEGLVPREMLLDLERETSEPMRAVERLWHPGYLEHCRSIVPADLRDRVRFESWMTPEEIAVELSAAAALLVPSVCQEALSMPAVEALGAGVPVIGSRVGGIPELVTDGVNGMLVPAGDVAALGAAIETFTVDRSLRQRLRGNTHLSSDRFEWDRIAERVVELYRVETAQTPAVSETPSSGAT